MFFICFSFFEVAGLQNVSSILTDFTKILHGIRREISPFVEISKQKEVDKMNPELAERLELIEFRQRLLFDNDDFSRLLFEYEVTKQQYLDILDLFDSLRQNLENDEQISSGSYESDIYRIVPQHQYNYHFAEEIAQTLHEQNRYEEVFEALYGDTPKFQTYLQNKRN